MSHALEAKLCVLSSSSSGNCSLLCIQRGPETTTILVDAGLSPRRTRRHLEEIGHASPRIDHVILTHLDADHWNAGWVSGRPDETIVHVHRRHARHAEKLGVTTQHTEVFDAAFELLPGLWVHPLLVAHDDLGTAAFRFEFAASGRTLGYATDTGRPTQELCDHLKDVDVLAIESNYCPAMQEASNRPAFLKKRIMGGKGHLSNQESARAVARIAPREALVLLHLSRQCNHPDIARREHTQPVETLVIAKPDAPTPWIGLVDPARHAAAAAPKVIRPDSTLWQA